MKQLLAPCPLANKNVKTLLVTTDNSKIQQNKTLSKEQTQPIT